MRPEIRESIYSYPIEKWVKIIKSMDAFILAAGRGERLRPLTNDTPKPLITVGGLSLIEHHFRNLRNAGFGRVIVNISWLAEQIKSTLSHSDCSGLEVVFSEETGGALETAGGIVHALNLIKTPCFVVINADIWTDFPLGDLRPEKNLDAGLVMVENPAHHPKGDFLVRNGLLKTKTPDTEGLTFAGIAWYRRNLFEHLGPGYRPLRPLLEQAIGKGRLGAIKYYGRWIDIGTIDRLQQAREIACRKQF